MLRVLLDMNLAPSWTDFLRQQGMECVHWSEVGAADAPDAVVMEWALQNDHIIMTT